ncbi:MAG: hypothetical protein ACXAD7_11055 [Candidatus Kariarchaeaceae archaeon]|jgi:hypothetical protein
MGKKLIRLLKMNNSRQYKVAISAAAVLAIVLLSISLGVNKLNPDDNNDPLDITPELDYTLTGDNYVLGLNSYMEEMYTDISHFNINGNSTTSVHPNLISSSVYKISEQSWTASAIILKDQDQDISFYTEFQFGSNELYSMHEDFLNAMDYTTEIDAPDFSSFPPGSIPELLMYTIFYEDGTGLEFVWLGFEDLDILCIEEIEWDENGYQVKYAPAGADIEYIPPKFLSPKSAFEPFLDNIQDLYYEPIEAKLDDL